MDSIFHYCLSVLSVEQSQVINVSNSFYSLEQRHQTNMLSLRQKNRGIAIVQTKSGRGAATIFTSNRE